MGGVAYHVLQLASPLKAFNVTPPPTWTSQSSYLQRVVLRKPSHKFLGDPCDLLMCCSSLSMPQYTLIILVTCVKSHAVPCWYLTLCLHAQLTGEICGMALLNLIASKHHCRCLSLLLGMCHVVLACNVSSLTWRVCIHGLMRFCIQNLVDTCHSCHNFPYGTNLMSLSKSVPPWHRSNSFACVRFNILSKNANWCYTLCHTVGFPLYLTRK